MHRTNRFAPRFIYIDTERVFALFFCTLSGIVQCFAQYSTYLQVDLSVPVVVRAGRPSRPPDAAALGAAGPHDAPVQQQKKWRMNANAAETKLFLDPLQAWKPIAVLA